MTKPLQRDAIYLKRHFDAEIADWPTTQGYHGLPRSGYPRWAPRGSAREDCEAAAHCRGRRLKTVVDRIAARKTTFPVHSLALVVNEYGQPLTYAGLRK